LLNPAVLSLDELDSSSSSRYLRSCAGGGDDGIVDNEGKECTEAFAMLIR